MTISDEARPQPGSEEGWQRYVAATTGRPPQPSLVRAAALFDAPGEALDVGAGAGRDTIHLLGLGWRVTAVDSSPAAAEALRLLAHKNLTVAITPIQDFEPASYDLVNAQYSLPFLPIARFDATIRRLRDAVRSGGVMAATFFGLNDEWNTGDSRLNFSTRAEVEQLFAGWEIVQLEEVEEDGTVATGGPKHWHFYQAIARKPPARAA